MIDPTPVLVATGLILALLAAALGLRGQGRRAWVSLSLAALAPIAACLTTLVVFGRSLAFPPKVFLDSVLVVGAAGVPLGVLVGLGGVRARLGVLGAGGLGVWLYLGRTASLHERYWDGAVTEHVAVLLGATLLAVAVRWVGAARSRMTESSLGFALAAVLAAPALGWSGTLVSALLAATISASSGLPGLLLLLRPGLREGYSPLYRAAALPQVLLLAGVLANGALYAETPPWAALSLLLAPLICLLPGSSVRFAVLRLLVLTAACGAAAWLSRGEPNPYG
ncbi:MAG: hypothetical protein ACPGPE_16835, partial [Planctomycetota bacterium]